VIEAYDDSTSTFAVPSGAGFQITFCPAGVSTNIIATVARGLKAKSSPAESLIMPFGVSLAVPIVTLLWLTVV
jgi:hypothetical protein